MDKLLLIIFIYLLSFGVISKEKLQKKTILFKGQKVEKIKFEYKKNETRYKDKIVDSTCTRQIPYTKYECNDVTKYRTEMHQDTCSRNIPYSVNECRDITRFRNECHWQPGRQICRTENNQRCSNETHYKVECTTRPSRRVCRDMPSRQVCRLNPKGQRVCHTVAGRNVCRVEPGQQHCNKVPYTERVCHNNPRQVCHQGSGQNICEDVPYQDEVCEDVTRYHTENYSCQVAVQVPYVENVCGDKTYYRDEEYACKKTIKVPYIVSIPVTNNVEINFVNDHRLNFNELNFSLTYSKIKNMSVLTTSSKMQSGVIAVTSINGMYLSDESRENNQKMNVEIFDYKTFMRPFLDRIKIIEFSSKHLIFKISPFDKKMTIEANLLIQKKKFLSKKKKIYFKSEKWLPTLKNDKGYYQFNFGKELKLKKYEVSLKIQLLDLSINIINSDYSLNLSKSYLGKLKPIR